MSKRLFFFLALIVLVNQESFSQSEVQNKARDEFEIKIDLSFKERPSRDPNSFNFADTPLRPSNGSIAYLTILFVLIKSNDESKIRIIQGHKGTIDKIKLNEVKKIEMGFIEDLKSEAVPNQLILFLLNSKKVKISKIILLVEADGTFMVNGEKRGRF